MGGEDISHLPLGEVEDLSFLRLEEVEKTTIMEDMLSQALDSTKDNRSIVLY